MGGLAVGAGVAGPASDRMPRDAAMRLYARLEIAIAALALLVPLALAVIEPLLSRAYADGSRRRRRSRCCGSPPASSSIAVPAVAMGATFPVVARWYVPDAAAATRDAGALYAANTVGAALGALSAGFVLLPTLGLRATTWTGVGLNLVVAAAAWRLAQRPDAGHARRPPPCRRAACGPAGAAKPGDRRPAAAARVARPWIAALGARRVGVRVADAADRVVAAAGADSRADHLRLQPGRRASSSPASALGAVAGRRLAVRVRQPAAGPGGQCCRSRVAGRRGRGVDGGPRACWPWRGRGRSGRDVRVGAAPAGAARGRAGWLPLAIALGCAFPFAVKTGTGRDASLGADLGLIYAVNTIGAIAGSLAAGFVLIPRLGLYDTPAGARRRAPPRPRSSSPGGPGSPARARRWPQSSPACRGRGQRRAAVVEPDAALERRLQVRVVDDRRRPGRLAGRRTPALLPRRRDGHRRRCATRPARPRWRSTARSTPPTPATC